MQHQKNTSSKLERKESYLTSLIVIYFNPQINLIEQMRLKQLSSCRERSSPACRINKGFCIDNRQSSVSGEGLQRRSEAATCNQGRSESLRGETARIYQSQMGSRSPSPWHVDVRHYLSRSQQHHAKDSGVNKHAALTSVVNCRL